MGRPGGWSWWRWCCPDADAMPRRDHGVDPAQCARRDVPPSSHGDMSATTGLVPVERCSSPDRLLRHVCRHHGAWLRGAMFPCPAREHRCTRACRVVAMRPRAPHCLVLITPTTEASSVVGRTRAVDAEASSCHWPQKKSAGRYLQENRTFQKKR